MAAQTKDVPTKDKQTHRETRSPTRRMAQPTQTTYRERSIDRSTGPDKTTRAIESETRGRSKEREDSKVEPDNEEDGQSISEMNEQEMMMKLMGFGSFDSTKGKHVAGVGSGSAKKNKATKYRQYMNREGGFNRALSPDRKKK